ncbi:hypothetical protein RHGRI_033388 [Rhododendron griersonianum]|uniref:Uncharacterized protein n=1 Tax=Rhododendron griersonianum TaxID=479676 RepID=A0AAV6HZ49_9ERIC|nr:hypothetical protein RHGRI_033388 [Rhododendron griersonianum]
MEFRLGSHSSAPHIFGFWIGGTKGFFSFGIFSTNTLSNFVWTHRSPLSDKLNPPNTHHLHPITLASDTSSSPSADSVTCCFLTCSPV